MKVKYYLARLLGGRIQYSDEYWTSYQKAMNARKKQVIPQQWLIVVNPITPNYSKRVDLESTKVEQGKLLEEAHQKIRDAACMLLKLIL